MNRDVIWIGPIPPPVHGASTITVRFLALVVAALGRDRVRVVSVAGQGAGWRHHRTRAVAHLRAFARVALARPHTVVYVSLSGGLGLWYQLPVVALARLRAFPVVVHHHSWAYVSSFSPAMAGLARLLGPRDRHLFLSGLMRDGYVGRYTTGAAAEVVSNAHFIEGGEHGGRAAPGECPRLVHVSNLSVAKGSLAAIRAHEELRRRGLPTTLTLIGPCHDRQVRAAITAAGDDVRWLGPCFSDEIYAELADADVFLFPSSYANEAEPLVVLEALSRGVPVIATWRGTLPDLLPSDWLVVEPDPAALADRVEALLAATDPAAERRRARTIFHGLRRHADPVELVLDTPAPAVPEVRVLQVLPTFDPAFGGPVSAALGVTRSYEGVDGITLTTVGTGRPGPSWTPFRTVGMRSWTSPRGPRHVLTVSWPMLRWLVGNLRSADLVHIHYQRSLLMVWVPLLARLAGVPYVLQTHGMCSPWSGPRALVDRLFTRPALRGARSICVLNPGERDEMARLAPDTRAVIVHNAVPTVQLARPDTGTGSRLLFCARLHPRKGLAVFLEVVTRLVAERPDLEAHVIGADEGALPAARRLVALRGLPVVFHGGMDRDEVDRWMTSCDVLLHPAPREPFGMSMLEAFAADLPVVAAASSQLAGVFAEEDAALLPADDDVAAWTDAVVAALDDEVLRARLRAGGRRVLERHFSPASLTGVLTDVVAASLRAGA